MIEAIFMSGLFKITLAALGVVAGWSALRFFDLINGGGFYDWFEKSTDRTKGIYYAARFVGVMLVIGLAIS